MRDISERVVKGRNVIGVLQRVMKGRNVSSKLRIGLRNSTLLPLLRYGSETWMQNKAQQSRVCTLDMSYVKGSCRVIK